VSETVERDRVHWEQYPIMSARMNANILAHGTPNEERFINTQTRIECRLVIAGGGGGGAGRLVLYSIIPSTRRRTRACVHKFLRVTCP
jgi:hypothetical protein